MLRYILCSSADLAEPMLHGICSYVCDHGYKYQLATICGTFAPTVSPLLCPPRCRLWGAKVRRTPPLAATSPSVKEKKKNCGHTFVPAVGRTIAPTVPTRCHISVSKIRGCTFVSAVPVVFFCVRVWHVEWWLQLMRWQCSGLNLIN